MAPVKLYRSEPAACCPWQMVAQHSCWPVSTGLLLLPFCISSGSHITKHHIQQIYWQWAELYQNSSMCLSRVQTFMCNRIFRRMKEQWFPTEGPFLQSQTLFTGNKQGFPYGKRTLLHSKFVSLCCMVAVYMSHVLMAAHADFLPMCSFPLGRCTMEYHGCVGGVF